MFLCLWAGGLTGQEIVENFRLNLNSRPYIGSDGLVLRSIEDNVTTEQWPEAKRSAYAQYPLAIEMRQSSIPMTGADAYAQLKSQSKPIAIGHRWVKSLSEPDGPPVLRRIVFWFEPRPKYLNDDELNEAAKRGDFDGLVPPLPIGGLTSRAGFPLISVRYIDFPIIAASTRLPPGGQRLDVMPVQFEPDLYVGLPINSEELIAQEIDMELTDLGSGRTSRDEIIKTPSGIVLKTLGTQFGHTGYRWVSRGNLFKLAIMGKDRTVLEAFLKQNPSELPADYSLDVTVAGMVILRRGLARLRAAPSVLEDDRHMIRIRPLQNRDQFQYGIELLKALKDLWPVVYGYEQARRERYKQHLSPESKVFSWQSYIEEETAARAEVIVAVTAFAEQAERRGLIRQEKVSRRPWADWAEDALPPCYVLGLEK